MSENNSLFNKIAKKMVETITQRSIEAENSVSTELMRQCMEQDHTVFNEESLDVLSPDYKNALQELIETGLALTGVDDIKGTHYVSLQDAYDALKSNQGQNSLTLSMQHDLAQALSNVSVTANDEGIVVTDYFDFDHLRTQDGVPRNDSHLSLAAIAINNHFFGDEATRNLAVGRIFCKEGEHGHKTESSIPVKIQLDVVADETMIESQQSALPTRLKDSDERTL